MKRLYRISYLLLAGFIFSCQNNTEDGSNKEITVYCAAGMKPAIVQIAKAYKKEYGVTVNLQYGGSGTLLSNLMIAKRGDLYLAADESYIEKATNQGLIEEVQPLAYLTPVIAVKSNNPQNINELEDLKRENVKLAIANPDAASIGRLTKKILKASGEWEELSPHISVMKPTVNEIANDVKIGAVDAAIVWDAVANQYPEMDFIKLDEWDEYKQQTTIGVLKSADDPTAALKFLRYISAKDKGLAVFSDLGYNAIEGDPWDEKPELLFYSGGVNRLAIEKTIQDFEDREGVDVVRVYNGCGILVSQIKAGQQPDAYLSCDVSFMNEVEGDFQDINDVSTTDIVIATDSSNDYNITDLDDLTKEGLKLGVCNPKQSALGALTVKLLDDVGLKEKVMRNVVVQTPTADLLVNQLRTGALDAAIVYSANVALTKDKLSVIKLDWDAATATQNIGINVDSEYKYLTRRLYQKLTSQASKNLYLENGFNWLNPN